VSRLTHLDWLRGLAVLIMIEAHTIDSWTRVADRKSDAYQWATVIAGFGAPAFLFLAGISLMLAAGGRLRRGVTPVEVARSAFRRGLWIFALAFLFRLQSVVISGASWQSMLKVDILNIMGIAMMAGALSLAIAPTLSRRLIVFSGLTVAVAMSTPLIREMPLLDGLPDWLEAYLRPLRGRTNFTLVPWAAFFTGGCVVGACLDAWPAEARRLNLWLAVAGASVALAGYATSFLPPIFREVSFWTSSPTFFFLRLGILTLSVPAAYALGRVWEGQALQEFGRASLFVYWIHVELVYGLPFAFLHRRLSFPMALLAFALFALALFGLVRLKNRVQQGRSTQTDRVVSGFSRTQTRPQ